MKTLMLTATAWVFIVLSAFSQHQEPGVYLPLDIDKKNCQQKTKMVNSNEVFCLAGSPVIKQAEFKWISDIYYEPTQKVKVFDINLSGEGRNVLKTLTSSFPNKQLVVVVDDRIVSAPTIKQVVTSGKIKIWEEIQGRQLKRIHRQLKKQLSLQGGEIRDKGL